MILIWPLLPTFWSVTVADVPEKVRVTVPAGTPFSTKVPCPSMVAVMVVPATVTVTTSRAPTRPAADELAKPCTVPVMVAPVMVAGVDGSPGAVGEAPAGLVLLLPPHAATDAAAMTTVTAARNVHRFMVTGSLRAE